MAIWTMPVDDGDDYEQGDIKVVSDKDIEYQTPGLYETLTDLFFARQKHYRSVLVNSIDRLLIKKVRGSSIVPTEVALVSFELDSIDAICVEGSDTEFIMDTIIIADIEYSYPNYAEARQLMATDLYRHVSNSEEERFAAICRGCMTRDVRKRKFRVRSRENALYLDDDNSGYGEYPADVQINLYRRCDDLSGIGLTECLVGVLSLEQIEMMSEHRLHQHGMERSIDEKGYVDMWEYAEKIGAEIHYARLSLDGRIGSKVGLPGKIIHVYEYYGAERPNICAINGQLTLEGVDAYKSERIPFVQLHPGISYEKIELQFDRPMILIDPYVCDTESREQDAISHEVFHIEEHSRFTLLQNHQKTRISSFNMTEDDYAAYEADREKYAELALTESWKRDKKAWDEIDWIEWQARMGAVRKRMPRRRVRKRVQELFNHYRNVYPHMSQMKMATLVISDLALEFHVSKEMARIRMEEVGYDFVRGASLWIGDKYALAHRTSTGVIPRNISYAISDIDAARLYVEDERFYSVLLSGKFVFADNFFCIDTPEFIEIRNGEKHLNGWALMHVDLCCLSFHISRNTRTAYYDRAALHSDQGYSDPITTALAGIPIEVLMESQADIDDKCKDLPKTYGETLVYHRDRVGMSQEELAWQLGIKKTTLRDYEHSRMFEPSRIFFASVGRILKLPGYYTKDMMKKAHCSLEFSDDALKHLDFVVTFMYMRSYEECITFLQAFNLPPLMGRTEQEIQKRLSMRKGKIAGQDARTANVSAQLRS